MNGTASAHVDSYCRDHLPPADSWPTFLFDRPELAYPARVNCAVELVDQSVASGCQDRPCLIVPGGKPWTYADLLAISNRIASVLASELGVIPGNRVLLRGPNSPWLAAAWLAVLKAGAVAVTVMPQLRAGELRPIIELAKPAAILCDYRSTDELPDAGVPLITFGGHRTGDLCDRLRRYNGHFDNVDTAADDIAIMAFTSGTTGKPKGAVHSHRGLLAGADTFSAHVLRPFPDDIFIGSPHLGFTYGIAALLIDPLRAGASVLLVEDTTADNLAAEIARHRATILFSSPVAYRAMLTFGATGRLSSLRRCVSAGEPLPVDTWTKFFQATGIRIIDGFGTTELGHIVLASADDDIRPGSAGRVVPGYTATVLDVANQPVAPGVRGRLAVKGPTGCRYLADDRQADYVQGGWNITGDMFSYDEDGYFWFGSRADDLIVSSGYKIAGPEVEDVLLSHPDVAECAVVGESLGTLGTVVKAFVVLRKGRRGDASQTKALQDFATARLSAYKVPRRIEYVDSLPRTLTGKVQRSKLRH